MKNNFTQMRLDIVQAVHDAIALCEMTDLERAQARALGGLASLAFDRIPASPCAEDAMALAEDLRAIWEIVDPLIAEIGTTAISELGLSSEAHKMHFERQLEGALDGNATYELTALAEKMDEEARDEI